MKQRKFLSGILFLLMLLPAFPASAQQVRLSADRDSIRYGERVRLHLLVEGVKQGDSIRVQPRGGGLEIVKQTDWDTLRKGNPLTLARDWWLTGWDVGDYTIPAWQVRVGNKVLQTDSLHIRVADMKVDTLQPAWLTPKEAVDPGKPAKPVRLGKATSLLTWLMLFWLAALLVVVGTVLYVLRKAKPGPPAAKEAYMRSFNEWEQLKAGKGLIDDSNAFYTRLTDILRAYMERALGIPALEMVSQLLLGKLKNFRFENNATFPDELLKRLEDMFRRADLAKFAKFVPTLPQRDADLETAKDFLDYAHQVLEEIESEKREQAERLRKEAARRSRTRNAVIIGLFLLLMVPVAYVVSKGLQSRLNNAQNPWVWKLNNIPQPKDWYAVSYGPVPSLAFRTPVVPKAVSLADSLHSRYPDVAVLTGSLDGTELVVLTATAKPGEKTDVAGILQSALPQSELTSHTAQWLADASGKIKKVKDSQGRLWWIRFWREGNQARLLAIRAPEKGVAGQMAELIAASARLVEPQNKTP